jgi:iron(III) transport system substrate-binding protein
MKYLEYTHYGNKALFKIVASNVTKRHHVQSISLFYFFAVLGLWSFCSNDELNSAEPKSFAQLEWDKTVQAAKKEGELFVYASDTAEILLKEFEKKYQIKVVTAAAGGGGRFAVERLLPERRAGRYIADLYIWSPSTGYILYQAKIFDSLKRVLSLPEVLDQSKWWQEKHHYVDPEAEYLLNFEGGGRAFITYNTDLVNASEFKSHWDLLNPRWKGKIVLFDPAGAFASGALKFFYYNAELGPEFLRRLFTTMDAVVSRDLQQIVDWLATGKFPISILAAASTLRIDKAKDQGLPVSWFRPNQFKEGAALASGAGTIALINKAPHPNAAKVAINWLLSREGQMGYQRIHDPGHDSLRIDIPKDDVPLDVRRIDGVKYLFIDRPEWIDMKPITTFIDEISAKGSKK